MEQQVKKYVKDAIQSVLDINIAQVGTATNFATVLTTVIDVPLIERPLLQQHLETNSTPKAQVERL